MRLLICSAADKNNKYKRLRPQFKQNNEKKSKQESKTFPNIIQSVADAYDYHYTMHTRLINLVTTIWYNNKLFLVNRTNGSHNAFWEYAQSASHRNRTLAREENLGHGSIGLGLCVSSIVIIPIACVLYMQPVAILDAIWVNCLTDDLTDSQLIH